MPLRGVRSNFQDLRAYRNAVELADEIYGAVEHWPLHARMTFGGQLIRAIDSVGANIAEGCGRYHPADRRRLLLIARGSLHETEHWIARAEKRGLLPHGSTERLEEIAKPLNGLIKRPT